MKILAIETSCDDTGIAILEVKENKNGENPEFFVLANEVASQIKVHKKYGGVFPSMAKREHQKNLVPTFIEALREANMLKNMKSEIRNSKQILNTKYKILNTILGREPELAKKLIPVLKKYSPPARAGKPDIDYIAVTNGPGLEPCLWVGVNFARALSYFWNIPIIPVNHIEGHILVNLLTSTTSLRGSGEATDEAIQSKSTNSRLPRSPLGLARNDNTNEIKFPAISLVVSGGHTQIVLVEKPFDSAQGKLANYKILGETRDDAAGECFDKAAKILGLGYPGGPIISELALKARPSKALEGRAFQKLPRPMLNTKDYDMSFSGLKTAILYAHRKQEQAWLNLDDRPNLTTMKRQYNIEMAHEIQQAIIDVLLKKTFKAVKDFNARTIILGGGVSANSELRKQFQEARNNYNKDSSVSLRGPATTSADVGGDEAIQSKCTNPRLPRRLLAPRNDSELNLVFPEPALSTDNGLMIAIAGYFNKQKTTPWQKLKADSNLRIGE